MSELTFTITEETIELCQLLKAVGWCHSGGMAKLVIAQGEVTVDDAVETRKTCKIRQGQKVAYDGNSVTILR